MCLRVKRDDARDPKQPNNYFYFASIVFVVVVVVLNTTFSSKRRLSSRPLPFETGELSLVSFILNFLQVTVNLAQHKLTASNIPNHDEMLAIHSGYLKVLSFHPSSFLLPRLNHNSCC